MVMGRKAYKWVLRDWLSLHDLRTAADLVASMRYLRQISPQSLDGPSGDRLLVLAPHPDDEVIGPGGTLIKAVGKGGRVRVLFLTSGGADEAAVREEEARAAAAACGFEPVFAKGLSKHIELKAASDAIVAAADEAPAAIFLPFVLDDHDDHRRSNEALMAAFDSGSLARSTEVWAYQVYSTIPGNVVVDITDVADRKAEAIRRYGSQMRSRDWVHFALGLTAFNSRLVPSRGAAIHVESFFVVPLPDYVDLCRHYFSGQRPYYVEAYQR